MTDYAFYILLPNTLLHYALPPLQFLTAFFQRLILPAQLPILYLRWLGAAAPVVMLVMLAVMWWKAGNDDSRLTAKR